MNTRLCLSLLLCGLLTAGCDKLKKKEPAKKPDPRAVPEIVDDPAAAPAAAAAPAPIDPAVPALTINKSAQAIVLGYHDFITGVSKEPMQINAGHFRRQMQALKDAKLAVISLNDFLAWRRGEKDIPDPSVVITIDDGWDATYNLAFPVLKEFGYPFTVYLYKKFLNGGGKSMSTAEVKEMMAAGATIGCHSVSHPYMAEINRMFRKSQEEGEKFLEVEMKDSRQFLEDIFAVKVTTYAYPGGYYTPREEEVGRAAGYEAMFTVTPARVTWDTPATALGRFIIYGTDKDDSLFRRAISLRGSGDGALVRQLLDKSGAGESPVKTKPEPDAVVTSRRPVIEVDVSQLPGVDPASIVMKIGGFGTVPATFDADAGVIRYQPNESLRTRECHVYVTFKRSGEPKADMVSWRFSLDLDHYYLPGDGAAVEKAVPVAEEEAAPEPAPQ
jgi:peptidoglycan/xylan/chitin deacetylase (PgdA/CDA1 family)